VIDPDYDNPDLLVYLQDLHMIRKDDSESYENRVWAREIIKRFKRNEYGREEFLSVCRYLDKI
jgi:hypothetical protein